MGKNKMKARVILFREKKPMTGRYLLRRRLRSIKKVNSPVKNLKRLKKCENCKKDFEVNRSEKHWKTHCRECFFKKGSEVKRGYSLRTPEKTIELNCNKCTRPYKVNESEKNWKNIVSHVGSRKTDLFQNAVT